MEKCSSVEELAEREKFWIAFFGCLFPNGYNCATNRKVIEKTAVNNAVIAHRLRELREKIGLSQREVAERIGVTRAAYNKYECGASKPIRRLNMLSSLFGVSTDYILGKNETDFESDVNDVNSKTYAQLRKYIGLSDFGKEIVDITLDAVFEREKRVSKTTV